MAGTFPGIANTQNVDANGQPLAFSVLTIYQGGTLVLADVFQDIGLAIPGQNPVTADITSRLPLFYVADGTYRVRLVDQFGVSVFDYPQVPAIGASASGGGGSAVDATTIFQVGDPIWVPISGTRTGWVRANARTIGSATSGASERANADCQNLFLYLWNNFPDTKCLVVSGRGASAAADWAANKQITLLDLRGRGPFGLDAMGGAASGRLTGALFAGADTAATAAGYGGEAAHILSVAEIPSHNHGGVTGTENQPHDHSYLQTTTGGTLFEGGSGSVNTAKAPVQSGATTGQENEAHNHNIPSQGGGGAHNSMPPFALGSWYLKL